MTRRVFLPVLALTILLIVAGLERAPLGAQPSAESRTSFNGTIRAIQTRPDGVVLQIEVTTPAAGRQDRSREPRPSVTPSPRTRPAGMATVVVERDTRIVFVVKSTQTETSGSIASLRVGQSVKVQGFRLNDGRINAVRIIVLQSEPRTTPQTRGSPAPRGTRPPRETPSPGATGGAQEIVAAGVVTGEGPGTLNVVDRRGTAWNVSGTNATRIVGRLSFDAVALYDIVRVTGTGGRNVVSATQIDVTFPAGPPVSGRITTVTRQGSGVMLGLASGARVSVGPETFVVSGGRLRALGDLREGMEIRVYGLLSGSGTAGHIEARVIVF